MGTKSGAIVFSKLQNDILDLTDSFRTPTDTETNGEQDTTNQSLSINYYHQPQSNLIQQQDMRSNARRIEIDNFTLTRRASSCFQNITISTKVLSTIFIIALIILISVLVTQQTHIEDCSNANMAVCLNGGSCSQSGGSYICDCALGFEGSTCEIDKDDCSERTKCHNGGTCVDGVSSFSCLCPTGFVGTFCERNDNLKECTHPGACLSDENSALSPCRCREGFVADPADRTKCKYETEPNATLIFTAKEGLREISLYGRNRTRLLQKYPNIKGFDYIFKSRTIFWSDFGEKKIYKAMIDDDEETPKTIVLDVPDSNINGLAIDWIHDHIYWTDHAADKIFVAELDGTMKKTLIDKDLTEAWDLVVNPLNGWMFWADWGTSRIERAGMDGSRRKVIVSGSNKWPVGLAIDFDQNRLYWVDAETGYGKGTLSSSKLDGTDQQQILNAGTWGMGNAHFFSITIFGNEIYWRNQADRTMYKANKCTGQEVTAIYIAENNDYYGDVEVYDASMQPDGKNLGANRVGRCSHLCLASPQANSSMSGTTICACPDGLNLSSDSINCY